MTHRTGLEGLDDVALETLARSDVKNPKLAAMVLRECHARGVCTDDNETLHALLHAFTVESIRELRDRYGRLFSLFWKDNGRARAQVDEYILQVVLSPEAELDWPWPLTDVPTGPGTGSFGADFEHKQSALHVCGYRAGKTEGMEQSERRRFLSHFFTNRLPAKVQQVFGQQYGAPGTETRLQKMANVIASNCRNFKKNDRNKFSAAIADWEDDLEYLKRKYYIVGSFPWPPTYGS